MSREALVVLCALVLVIGLSAYTVLGGADFGGGVWDAFAVGPRRDAQRAAIADAMGPVWEANHVWLIFAIVMVFTAFPLLFGTLFTALSVPISLALIGIVLRGAAFVFRSHADGADATQRAWGRVFSTASVVTPFWLGACAAVIAEGKLREHVVLGPGTWLAPLPILSGLLAVALCALLAASYLAVETQGTLRDDFRRRALGASVGVAALAAIGVPLARSDAPRLANALLGGRATVATVIATLAAVTLAVALRRGFVRWARFAAATLALSLLWGFALATWPQAIAPNQTFATIAAPNASLKAALVVASGGSLLLIPALGLLFAVFKRTATDATPDGAS